MRDPRFDGVITALVTTYDKNGQVEPNALKKHTNFCIEGGVNGDLACGGSGQYVNMTKAQREVTVKTVVEAAAGRVPVVAGVLEPGLGEALDNAKIALGAGADALLITPPYYVRPTQEGIYDYYAELYSKLNAPIIAYNFPGRLGTMIEPATLAKMMREIPGIVADKECTDYTQFLDTVRQVGDDGAVLCGSDLEFADQVLAGAKGGVLAASCILPNVYAEIWKLAKEGNCKAAHDLSFKYFSLVQSLFVGMRHPAPTKMAMALMGQEIGEWVVPVNKPDEAQCERLKCELAQHGMLAK